MPTLYDLPAPAKLNLFLHIVGQRHDGYHLLQSAFMLIDWCDRLHLELRPQGQISREDLACKNATPPLATPPSTTAQSPIPAALPEEDLCVRAARALQQATGTRLGVHIGLEKNIPTQAGMGGGSSDAASVLLGLNQLWHCGLNKTELQHIGLSLGADVPFFLADGHAWVEGIGEQLSALALPAQQFIVIKPTQGVATAQIFAHPDLPRSAKPAIISFFAENPFAYGVNCMQAVAVDLCPDIGLALQILHKHGLAGRMTGSGSAVFAPVGKAANPAGPVSPVRSTMESCAQQPTPSQLLDNIAADCPSGWNLRLCSNMEAHPLLGWSSE